MNALKNHMILFDAECPICKVYTRALVSTGVLNMDERAAYQNIAQETCPMLDRQRAVNEIALIDQTTGEVSYGINSLFKVLAVAIPVLKPLLQFSPFVWLMSKVYAFISYNRRVIAPVADAQYHLQPTFRLDYRMAYLLFTWAITSYILTAYVHLMYGLLPQGNTYREYLICGGQVFFQSVIVTILAKDKLWAYLGNMMTISFAGAMLLLPGITIAAYFSLNPIWYVLYFLAVAGLMFLEHIRRVRILKLGWTLTISWALYRLMVLLFIFWTK